MAPNRELIALLEKATGKPCFLMGRGVDTDLFHPRRRDRPGWPFTIGYVGRITVGKNVEALVEIERGLSAAGLTDYQLLIVGQGSSENYLRANLKKRDLAGVLRGEELARAYANMDVFVFPSKTDTFGNVVLEALASGVPALVTDQGGPQFIVKPGEAGYVCKDNATFVQCIHRLHESSVELDAMRLRAAEAGRERLVGQYLCRGISRLRNRARAKRTAASQDRNQNVGGRTVRGQRLIVKTRRGGRQ